MRKLLTVLIVFAGLLYTESHAQTKTVMLDISLEDKSAYLNVSPQIFENYREIIEDQLGAKFILNEDQEVDSELLKKTEVLIILSTLSSTTNKKSRTTTEINAIVNFVKNGGRLIFFTDEDRRVNIEYFGANEIVRPFGLEFGNDLPMLRNAGAISFIGEFIKGRYELPYSGSRELKGGIPISVMNAEGGNVHGAYTQTENGGKLVAFGETMVGLFIGGVEAKMPDGSVLVWKGKDNYPFMKELTGWMLKD